MEDWLLTFHAPTKDDLEEDTRLLSGPEGAAAEFGQSGYLIRIVRSLGRLAEKISIFDAHLDDRAIEIYKQYLMPLVEDELSEDEDGAIEIYFGAGNEGVQGFDIPVDGKRIMGSPFTEDLYHSLEADYGKGLPDLRQEGPIVDDEYVMRAIRTHSKQEQEG